MVEIYIKQVSNNRYLDAYEGRNDNDVVTRDYQNNDLQKWILSDVKYERGVGYIAKLQQKNTKLYLDAYESSANDYRVVTRDKQENTSQMWVFTQINYNQFTIQQLDNMRFMDAHEHQRYDFSVVTRLEQSNNTQLWEITRITPLVRNAVYTIATSYNGPFLCAHENSNRDYQTYLDAQSQDSNSEWIIYNLSTLGEVKIQQRSTERYLDAYKSIEKEHTHGAVTRSDHDDDHQTWILEEDNIFQSITNRSPAIPCIIRQKSTGYTLHVITLEDGSKKVVTIEPPERWGNDIDTLKARDYLVHWLLRWSG